MIKINRKLLYFLFIIMMSFLSCHNFIERTKKPSLKMISTGTSGGCPVDFQPKIKYTLRDSKVYIDSYFNDNYKLSAKLTRLLPDSSFMFDAYFKVDSLGKIYQLVFEYKLNELIQTDVRNFIYKEMPPINSSFYEQENKCNNVRHTMTFEIISK